MHTELGLFIDSPAKFIVSVDAPTERGRTGDYAGSAIWVWYAAR